MERTVILTPECYKLWSIRQGLVLLYDKIVMDKHDYDKIILKQDNSTYDHLVYKATELLKKEGFINVINYEEILTKEKRKEIRNGAKNFISELPEKELISLTLHAHKEFERYLKSVLTFCYADEPKYQDTLERLKKIKQRMDKFQKTKRITEEHIETLELNTAKIIASITFVSSYSQGGILHDTNEYKPFFEKYKNARSVNDLSFEEKDKNFNLKMVIASVFNKPFPTVEIYDEMSFYESLKVRQDFEELKKLIKQMEEIYEELLETDREKVFEELKKEIRSISNAYDKEFKRLKSKFFRKILWGTFEEIGAKYVPLFKIFLDPLCKLNDEMLRREIEKKIVNKESLGGKLYLLYKKIMSKKPGFELPRLKHYNYQGDPVIWGERGAILPWYIR